MSIIAADFTWRHSGGASNSDPNADLGGAKSSVQLTDNTKNNLFDDVTSSEHTAGDTEYRCLYLHNANSTDTMQNVVVWISSDTTGADTDLSIGLGTSAVNGTETSIANENTAPASVTFSDAAVSRATGLSIGTLTAGQHKAVWFRRTTTAGSTPQANDTAQFQAGGDTL